jgi:branched-subunit amino acid aminotransferase/4-amino-4-deoxychorismate lyase
MSAGAPSAGAPAAGGPDAGAPDAGARAGEVLHVWQGDELLPLEGGRDDEADPRLLVADSWLVDDGRVLALDVHRDRFAGSVADAATGPDADEVTAFWSAAVAALPRTGAWFPRVELVADERADERPDDAGRVRLQLRLRPAPPRRRSVVLATADHDPRTHPTVKGPDLAALGGLVADARARGADEAVLLSPEGHVVEGAWSSIVWWRGDALCLPADDLPRLPGVTLRTLTTLAAVLGVDVLHDRTRPDELDGFEVWSLSALHGLRIVTGWVEGPSPAEEPGRLALWRGRLERLRRPIDG